MTKHQVGRAAVWGALIGDAAGATLEFIGRKPDRAAILRALKMVGGGCWRTAPGQITDDGEMELCLMQALAGQERFSVERVAQQYLRWYQSLPFDIGVPTRTGLAGGLNQPAGRIHVGMGDEAERSSQRSKANGGLMRIAPLGVWGWRLSEEDLVDAACQDNRPYLRCLHGYGLCLWRLGYFDEAEEMFERMLWLNPVDNQGARFLIAEVREKRPWRPDL